MALFPRLLLSLCHLLYYSKYSLRLLHRKWKFATNLIMGCSGECRQFSILCMLYIVLLFKDIELLSRVTFNPDIQETKYVRNMWPFVLAFPINFCAPVTIYFGVKFNFPIPSIYPLPAKLLCCCSEKCAQALVLSLTLWFDLVASISR